MSDFSYLASRTISNGSIFAKMIREFMNVVNLGCSSLFTGEMISFFPVRQVILSCKRIGILLARCFLKTASSFRGKLRCKFTFPTSKIAYTFRYYNKRSAKCSNSFFVMREC